jgi:hypothetical protein
MSVAPRKCDVPLFAIHVSCENANGRLDAIQHFEMQNMAVNAFTQPWITRNLVVLQLLTVCVYAFAGCSRRSHRRAAGMSTATTRKP